MVNHNTPAQTSDIENRNQATQAKSQTVKAGRGQGAVDLTQVSVNTNLQTI